MATPWMKAIRQKKLDRTRKQKLIEKAQKAGVIADLAEVFSIHSWNKRFGFVQRKRSGQPSSD